MLSLYGLIQVAIPMECGHPFRSKMATCSDQLWPVIPTQFGHP